MTFANYIQSALDYIAARTDENTSAESLREIRNDAANIFANNYREYLSIWHAIENQ